MTTQMAEPATTTPNTTRLIKRTAEAVPAPATTETERYRASLFDARRRLLDTLTAIELALDMDTERTRKPHHSQG